MDDINPTNPTPVPTPYEISPLDTQDAFPSSIQNHYHTGVPGDAPRIHYQDILDTPSTGTSRVRVHLSADQSTGGAGVSTQIHFNTEDYDDGSEFTPSNPFYRFDATQAGVYLVNLCVVFDGSAAGDLMVAMIKKNGVEYQRRVATSGGVAADSVTLTDQLKLAQGDYLDFWGQNSNGWKFLSNGSQPGTFVTIHRLS